METAVLPQLRSEDVILEHGDQQCNKVSVFDGPPGGGSLRRLPLSGRVGVGDRAMTRRPKPLPGDGVPQAVYALTECVQRRLMAHLQGTGLHWGLRRLLQELWIADGLSQAELATPCARARRAPRTCSSTSSAAAGSSDAATRMTTASPAST